MFSSYSTRVHNTFFCIYVYSKELFCIGYGILALGNMAVAVYFSTIEWIRIVVSTNFSIFEELQ